MEINIIQLILSAIPVIGLIIALVAFIKKYIDEHKWNQISTAILSLVKQAETKFTDGCDKEEFVVNAIKQLGEKINYQIDEDEIKTFITEVITVTKAVNTNTSKSNEE